ncbi:1-deoxy-D-xylulose-5-phosphate synthase [Inconstantimicrobium mannanitabidum]|uniref:1-deoxy-D-xylulose-5-phosphate synthase n=1 Tax=Inconstantimicrobium mannanitabidum TaxID=1604901 RepID=A0ACB5RBB3_9CLOT|nr:1-deoxy-D-xylulose-5-phosphate synthase [Clostridium sp. TW13]
MDENKLDKIDTFYDLKRMNGEDLEILAKNIREFLIEKVSKTGGHLASNLGVVELTISLFKVFNFDEDKIVWDVGHQSYVHKILTGRKGDFDSLRKFNGISGFPKCCESKYDFFNTGHSSTSISAAVGMARARDILNEKNNVIAVIGDGALTGGMAFEALNDVGYNKTKMIIILNDNTMAISENVGGMSTYLSKLRMGTGYNKLRSEINRTLNQSSVGKNLASSLSRFKHSMKQLVVPSMLFEDMGIRYFGPIDGHNIKDLCEVLCRAKNVDGPVIIHTITQKGKGYDFAEKNPCKFHAVAPFNFESGEGNVNTANTYSKEFGKKIIDLAEKNSNIVAITAAMPDGTGLSSFSEKFPKRFFDVGIAEEHAVTLAAGMAKAGLRPVFAVYSTFLQRAFDQILHDVCLQNVPVVFAIDRAGIVGEDGETHQGIFDISYLNLMPNINLVAPKCTEEVGIYLEWALKQDYPVAIRYPRGGDLANVQIEPIKKIENKSWEVIKKGEKVAVIATGKMVQHAIKALSLVNDKDVNPEVINANFIKPMDTEKIDDLCMAGYRIITVEDNIVANGLGHSITTYINQKHYKNRIINLGYLEKIVHQGDVNSLYKMHGLSPQAIADNIIKLYHEGE